jgi:hypothetical protein
MKLFSETHPLPEGCVAPPKRDLATLFMNIKGFVKPIQNAHVLRCTLRFRIDSRRALELNLGL